MNIPSISWPRVFVEGTAVVLSILLAFSIDAAWEQRQEKKADVARLRALYAELQSHKALLAEAIMAHGATVEYGYELLGLLSPEPTPDDSARMTVLLDGLLNFYRINAPFGSLQTASASGAIARMQDVELASALASWPTAIEDLIEEQELGSTLFSTDFFINAGSILSLRDMYEHRFLNPSVRGTDEVISEVAGRKFTQTLPAPDYSLLYNNVVFANDLLGLMMMAQSSQGEAVVADRKLDDLMRVLRACLDVQDC